MLRILKNTGIMSYLLCEKYRDAGNSIKKAKSLFLILNLYKSNIDINKKIIIRIEKTK